MAGPCLSLQRKMLFNATQAIRSQLPFRRYARFYFLRSSLAVAYDTYAREQMKLSFRVLSQSTVYQCLKGKFLIRKKIPFKDTQCTDCKQWLACRCIFCGQS